MPLDSESSEQTEEALEPDPVETLLDVLEHAEDVSVSAQGRVGGLPHVRYRHGEWQVATWAGGGHFIGRNATRQDIRELLESGPQLCTHYIDDLDVWEVFDGSLKGRYDELYFSECECGDYSLRSYREGAKTWRDKHVDECSEVTQLEVDTVESC